MDKLPASRLPPSIVAPAQSSGAIGQSVVPPATPYPDLILISLAEDTASEQPGLLAQAKRSGLSFETIVVDEPDGRDLPGKIAALHTDVMLGPGTQVVILMHGGIRDERHCIGTESKFAIDTCEVINALRCPPGSSKPVSQWKGVIHLISCHIAALGEGMRDRLGYCVLYGGYENTLCVDGLDTVKEMMRVFGRSKQEDGSAINAAHLFPHLASFTGEPITLTGNGRCDFIHPFDVTPVAFESEKSETERWMRILFSRLDHGTAAEVKRILDVMGAKLVNVLQSGARPLHVAATSGYESGEKIRLLLGAGAEIHATNEKGGTALTEACKFDNAEGVACLLTLGADPLLALDASSMTPFECALVEGHRGIVHLLLEHFFEPIEEVDIDRFLAMTKETSARSVVEMLTLALNE